MNSKPNLHGTNFSVCFIQVIFSKISYIENLYNVQFIQDSVLFWLKLGEFRCIYDIHLLTKSEFFVIQLLTNSVIFFIFFDKFMLGWLTDKV
jgi:hypothetical protein